jgi:hypothetical protein
MPSWAKPFLQAPLAKLHSQLRDLERKIEARNQPIKLHSDKYALLEPDQVAMSVLI